MRGTSSGDTDDVKTNGGAIALPTKRPGVEREGERENGVGDGGMEPVVSTSSLPPPLEFGEAIARLKRTLEELEVLGDVHETSDDWHRRANVVISEIYHETVVLKSLINDADPIAVSEDIVSDAEEEQARMKKRKKGGIRDALLTFVIIASVMVFTAKLTNWFAFVWIDWVFSLWSVRELPMLFVTVTMNSLIRSSERAAVDEEATNQGVDIDTGAQLSSRNNLFSREHMNRVRERFFETFVAFRLLVGFPLRAAFIRGVATIAEAKMPGVCSNFVPRLFFLLAVYIAFRFRSEVLRFGLPLFVAHLCWLVGGPSLWQIIFYPVALLFRVLDLSLLATGVPFISHNISPLNMLSGLIGVVAEGLYLSIGSSAVHSERDALAVLYWLLPAPTCPGEYFDAFSSAVKSFKQSDNSTGLGGCDSNVDDPIWSLICADFVNALAHDGDCVGAARNELYALVFTHWGLARMFWGCVLATLVYKTNVTAFFLKWLKEGSLDDMEGVLARRQAILNYAKSNPFRAKLHPDPKQFLAKGSDKAFSTKIDGRKFASLVKGSFDNLVRLGEELTGFGEDQQMEQAPLLETDQEQMRSSLQAKLEERAKSSTCAERIAALHEALLEIHGPPDAYDLLFRKVDIKVDRGKGSRNDSVGSIQRSIFLQVADQVVAHPLKRLNNGLSVKFLNESGVDGGALTSELFKLIAEELDLDTEHGEDAGIAIASAAPPSLLKALPDATLMLAANPEVDLVHYYALGRLIGLAVLGQSGFPLPLSSAMLKMMTDKEIDSEDVRALDPVYFQNRMLAMLNPGGVECMQELLGLERIPFVWIDSEGRLGTELCSNGATVFVDERNKLNYLQLLSEHYVCGEVREQMQIFLSGFREIVPANILADHKIDHVDLALALQGIAEIDVEDWATHTDNPSDLTQEWQLSDSEEHGISIDEQRKTQELSVVSTAQLVEWFWASVKEMSGEQRLRLLQFATARSTPPVGGFVKLKPRHFNLVVDPNPEHLPSSQTCFATLRLPVCASQSVMKRKLEKVCNSKELVMTFGES